MIKTLTLFILLFPAVLFAQVSITGKVISQADTKPVANASVFLSNATIGAHTAEDGTFTLKNVKPGKYQLVISTIGFDTYSQAINVESKGITLPPVTVFPKTLVLNAVTVKAQRHDPDRAKNYALFEDELLGTGPLAKECKIINPELLDLVYEGSINTLTASSADFLEIENKALGYRLKYFLKDFMLNITDDGVKTVNYSGSILFEKLKGSASQEKEWQRRRLEVYEGSAMHFLRSAVDDKLKQEGFRVMRLPYNPQRPADSVIQKKLALYQALKNNKAYKDSLSYWTKKSKLPKMLDKIAPAVLTRSDIITSLNNRDLFTLNGAGGALYISYSKSGRFSKSTTVLSGKNGKDNTLVFFNGRNALFDRNGAISDPQSVTYDGAWSRTRLAGMLPLDYEPREKDEIEIDTLLRNKLTAKLNAYPGNVIEKAYLQFDKPYYATGDTIYFKAYVTEGGDHTHTQLSGALYADLINGDNKLVKALKLQLTDGFAWGDFVLADTLKGGNYRARAYTNWMRNGGNDSFFIKEIPVGIALPGKISEAGPFNHSKSRKEITASKPAMQFLPEGGNLVAGNYSKIAFKAIRPDGTGIDVKGTVTDDSGAGICTFASSHLGMGSFNIVPQNGRTYTASIIYADGTSAVITLPKANSTGYTININNENPDTVVMRIAAAGTMEKLAIAAQSGGELLYTAESVPNGRFFTAKIPKNRFPTGITQFTVFNSDGEPLNERLVFIDHDDQLKIISKLDSTYLNRQKVSISLDIKDRENKPVTGSFSASVTDETKVPVDEQNETSILTDLLLTSDLRGTIEQPGYYFARSDKKTAADLDLLMLTQGYRTFAWKQNQYKAEKTLTISGKISKNGKPVPNGKITLFSNSGGTFLIDTLSGPDGRFTFSNLVFADSTKFVVQSKVAKGQDNVVLELDTVMPPALPALNTIAGGADTARQAALSVYTANQQQFYREQLKYGINKHAIMLREVHVKAKKEPVIPHSSNLNGSGNADIVFAEKDIDKMIGGNLAECLMGLSHPHIEFKNGVPKIGALVIDGNFVDPDVFTTLHPEDVEGIEIITGPHYGAIYGPRMAGGGMIITTRQAHKTNNYYRYAPGVITYMPKGYYKARQFYSPKYDNTHTNQKIADLRSTIFWKPDIITDKDGKASFSYFNADGKGTYRVVIEGIDADGNLGRQVFQYQVQ